MKRIPPVRSAIRPAGSALVAVLWLIAILAITAMATLQVVSLDVDVVSAQITGFRARQLAEAGIAVGANPAVARDDEVVLNQTFGDGFEGFEVRLASEAGRFNINALLLRNDQPLLRSMFMSWGLDMDQAEAVVDALSDWVDGDDFISLNGAEVDWYEERGRINQPFNRPFYGLDEMRLVAGMDMVEAARPDWRDWFTVWSAGALDVNEALPELIATAAEVSVEDATTVVETVLGPDLVRDTEDDARFENLEEVLAILGVPEMMRAIVTPRLTVNDTTTRIESIGYSAGARHRITLTVRNRTGRPAILEKTEEPIP
jgi:type II secretory pathway component PulK